MVKPRENRVPIMMSEDELKTIDDWRFGNRIATRSDAIRRLCQIGARFDASSSQLYQLSGTAWGDAIEFFKQLMKWDPNADQSAPDIERQLKQQFGEVFSKQIEIFYLVKSLTMETASMKSAGNFIDATADAKAASEKIAEGRAEAERLLEKMREDLK
ncbi:hypothetical protein [Rhizobium sp. NXC24]|uniref:hypothetical protein n=1 Tax=Rhizobium sp. NXC24 TaxID=2048897 RepID=UPI000CDF3D7C|nr:hypothetical protein [Rhizobium sp. NXC24]AVA21584.1 hypothetical protein NXC24_CH01945 [Rhizobium sp. NXC24]